MYRKHPLRVMPYTARYVGNQLLATPDVGWIVLGANILLVALDQGCKHATHDDTAQGTIGHVLNVVVGRRYEPATAWIIRCRTDKCTEIQPADHRNRTRVEA